MAEEPINTKKSTLSDYLAALGVDINNMQEFLNKLTAILVTKSDNVTISQTLPDGSKKDFPVPSFARLENDIKTIGNQFNSMLTANFGQVGVVDENGSTRRFELQDVSRVAQDLDAVAGKSLSTPVNFNYKTNWFFESFLNPLVYIDIPVGSLVTTPDIDKFEVKRVIMTSKTVEDITYFDATYKGQNNISYTSLIADFNSRGIRFFEDLNEVSLPPAQNTNSGSFTVDRILTTNEVEILAGETLTNTVSTYILNTIRYQKRSLAGANGTTQATLAQGDYLLSTDNSEFLVKSVNSAEKSIIIQRVFGLGSLQKGSVLTIKPRLEPVNVLSVNIGYNERQILFLRPISSRLKLSTNNFSQGIGFYTSELSISLGNGRTMSFANFYQQFVSDFGVVFLSYAKERKLPAALGEIPNAPVLETASFKVVQADQHVRNSEGVEQVKQNISALEQLRSQVKEIDQQISDRRAELNTNAALSEAQRLKLSKDLSTLSDSRKTSTTQISSKLSSITSSIRSTPTITANPTYTIKGFWHIPQAIQTQYGSQNVVQFKIAYRVLSKTGNSEAVEQITVTDPAGNKVVGSFSPWKEILSKVRGRKMNSQTGTLEWAPEDLANPDVVNMNQVEIPIAKGQVIEIKVKSLSQAGHPESPVESDWSNIIQIPFPDTLQSAEDISIISQQAFAEETKINFLDELNSKGLDLHLGTAFTTRDKYFAHRAEDIASGFRTANSEVIDLYTKLKSITDDIVSIQTSLASGQGELKVSIYDQGGNQTEVTNGQTVTLFAGYYKDQIKNAAGQTAQYEHGKIITKQYYIQLENTSQTPLELISSIAGGLLEKATASSMNLPDVYNSSLRYDIVPIVLNEPTDGRVGGFRQPNGLQSSQVKGQIIYSRAKSVTLSESLYAAEPSEIDDAETQDPFTNYTQRSVQYDYAGFEANSNIESGKYTYTIPYCAGHYLPFNPSLTNLTVKINGASYPLRQNPNIWNGRLSGSNAPVGGGLLSEFCISKDHPDLKKNGRYNKNWSQTLYLPAPIKNQSSSEVATIAGYTVSPSSIKKLPFSQAAHFEISQADVVNPLGAKYFQQATYRLPDTPNTLEPTSAEMIESNYPIKCSFEPNDKYLVGRYTCGAYMYISPTSYQQIGATSISPTSVKRVLNVGSNNAIKIPLIFQYRCSDYLKYIGGFRVDEPSGLNNVGYVKKMGFDIGLKDQVFSFDVEIGAHYDKDTSLVTPVTGAAQSAQLLS